MPRIAINGLGRIGKLVLRDLIDNGAGGDIVLINDPHSTVEQLSLLMEFDSVHGRWGKNIFWKNNTLVLDDKKVKVSHQKIIQALALKENDIDLVVDCTGQFKTGPKIAPYFSGGAKKVIISAPVKDKDALNLVYGINHDLYDGSQNLITGASCTTNCLAPIVKVIHENLGIKHGSITTIHDVTNTQTIVDRPSKDMRRARSALNNLIPTTTGSAKAITMIYPELKGKLNGHAVRVPLLNASLTDCVFEVERATSEQEVNSLFEEASNKSLKGILGFERRPLVSSDYTNDPRSSIVDGLSTMVVNKTQVKVYAWYDNEWGYSCRLGDITRMVAGSL